MNEISLAFGLAASLFLGACQEGNPGLPKEVGDNGSVVVQYRQDGTPIRCWELPTITILVWSGNPIIHWTDAAGTTVNLGPPYSFAWVANGRWTDGYKQLGLTRETCRRLNHRVYSIEQGAYVPTKEDSED
jgi:hypothetical protein